MFALFTRGVKNRFAKPARRPFKKNRCLQFESLEERLTPTLYWTTDLAITATSNPPSTISVGGEAAITLTITKISGDTFQLNSFTLVDSSSAGLINKTYSSPDGTYDQATGKFTLAPGHELVNDNDFATLTVNGTVAATATDSIVYVAQVTPRPGTLDSNYANNTTHAVILTINNKVTDLAITTHDVEFDGEYVQAEDQIKYEIVVTNNGLITVSGANILDEFPDDLEDIEWSIKNATPGSSVDTDNSTEDKLDLLATLAPQGSITIEVTAKVKSGVFAKELINTATVDAPADFVDTNSENDSKEAAVIVVGFSDLSVTLEDDAGGEESPDSNTTQGGTALANETIEYKITVKNKGPHRVVGATVSEGDLPDPSSFESVSWTKVGPDNPVHDGPFNTTVDLDADEEAVFIVTAKLKSTLTGGTAVGYSVGANVPGNKYVDLDGTNNFWADDIAIIPSGDLSITKSHLIEDGEDVTEDNEVLAGNEFTYYVTVKNTGNDTVSGVAVKDMLPEGITGRWEAVGDSDDSFAALTESEEGDIDTTVTLAPNGYVTFTIYAKANDDFTGKVENTATITLDPLSTYEDTTTNNNSATDTVGVFVVTDLSVTTTDSVGGAASDENPNNIEGGFAAAGSLVTFKVTVANNGPDDVKGATFKNLFLAADGFLPGAVWSVIVSPGSSVARTEGSGDINDLVDLKAGGTATYTIKATIDPEREGGAANNASVFHQFVKDTNVNNDLSTDYVKISLAKRVDLSIKSDGTPETKSPGEEYEYTIVVTNKGDTTATDVTIKDILPDGLVSSHWQVLSSTNATVTGDTEGDGNVDTVATLLTGGKITFKVTVTVSDDVGDNLSITNYASLALADGFYDIFDADNTDSDTVLLTTST